MTTGMFCPSLSPAPMLVSILCSHQRLRYRRVKMAVLMIDREPAQKKLRYILSSEESFWIFATEVTQTNLMYLIEKLCFCHLQKNQEGRTPDDENIVVRTYDDLYNQFQATKPLHWYVKIAKVNTYANTLTNKFT